MYNESRENKILTTPKHRLAKKRRNCGTLWAL